MKSFKKEVGGISMGKDRKIGSSSTGRKGLLKKKKYYTGGKKRKSEDRKVWKGGLQESLLRVLDRTWKIPEWEGVLGVRNLFIW